MTMMISCVSPSSEHLSETLLTLNYARKTTNIVNEPQITFNENGDVLVQEAEEFQIIKKQNDILIRENKDLRREIQQKIDQLENQVTKSSKQSRENRLPSTKEASTELDEKDQLIQGYEKQLVELNKGYTTQKNQNLVLARKMEVRR